jgi:hypothetical protein
MKVELVKGEIEEKRQYLIDVALSKGFTNSETIQVSQDLDQLLNCLNSLKGKLDCEKDLVCQAVLPSDSTFVKTSNQNR